MSWKHLCLVVGVQDELMNQSTEDNNRSVEPPSRDDRSSWSADRSWVEDPRSSVEDPRSSVDDPRSSVDDRSRLEERVAADRSKVELLDWSLEEERMDRSSVEVADITDIRSRPELKHGIGSERQNLH